MTDGSSELTMVKALRKQQKIVVRQAVKNNTILNRLKTKKKKSITKLANQVKDAAPGSRKKITKTAALKQAKTELRELKQQNKQAKLHAAEEQKKLRSYIRSQTKLEKAQRIKASKLAKKAAKSVRKQKNSGKTMKNVQARKNIAAKKSSQDNSWFF